MGFHRPYRLRHLPSGEDHHTFPAVGWLLSTLVGVIVVLFIGVVVFLLSQGIIR